MAHEFELRKEIALDATPEQIWDAIATGPGIDSWFMGRNVVEPREGGTVQVTMGDSASEATITVWEPAKRLAYRGVESPDGTFMAFEYLIEGRDGSSTVLRMVQSGFLSDNWESEYDSLDRGWGLYLRSLEQYLAYFPGQVATPIWGFNPPKVTEEEAWTRLTAALGLHDPISEGDPIALGVAGLAPIEGVIDAIEPTRFIGVRSADALYRFSGGGGAMTIGHHLFAEDVDPKESQNAWQNWLADVYA